jgi:hypothetical protein
MIKEKENIAVAKKDSLVSIAMDAVMTCLSRFPARADACGLPVIKNESSNLGFS